jgi:putative transposase
MQPGNTYHLFNHANGRENLFVEEKNYDFFLGKISKHILPVSHVYAYCMLPNHFHLLVKIKSEEELNDYFFRKSYNQDELPSDSKKIEQVIQHFTHEQLVKKISKSFSNLFNGYAQSFNKVYDRMGSLFMQNMKKKEIIDDNSFCKLVHYIHANPVHHRFVKTIEDWPHSSYKIFLSKAPTELERDYVLQLFGGIDWFIKYHKQPIDPKIKYLE